MADSGECHNKDYVDPVKKVTLKRTIENGRVRRNQTDRTIVRGGTRGGRGHGVRTRGGRGNRVRNRRRGHGIRTRGGRGNGEN